MLFFFSAFFDFVSHGLKESLVRNTPINQTRFNLNISIAQLLAGIALSPILLGISFNYDTYQPDSILGQAQQDKDFNTFYKDYISLGFKCAFNFVPPIN